MNRSIATGVFALSLLAIAALASQAENSEEKSGELAKALPQATVSLAQGLKVSEAAGTPISGKFEMEDGVLQLSVYTVKADKFSEIIVDHKSSAIKKTEAITDTADLKGGHPVADITLVKGEDVKKVEQKLD